MGGWRVGVFTVLGWLVGCERRQGGSEGSEGFWEAQNGSYGSLGVSEEGVTVGLYSCEGWVGLWGG